MCIYTLCITKRLILYHSSHSFYITLAIHSISFTYVHDTIYTVSYTRSFTYVHDTFYEMIACAPEPSLAVDGYRALLFATDVEPIYNVCVRVSVCACVYTCK